MGGIHHTPPALDFVLAINLRHNLLVIGEQYAVSPFLEKCSAVIARLVSELQLVAVIGSHFVRTLKLADNAMRRNHNINSCLIGFAELVQHPPEFFLGVCIPLAIPEVLDAVLLVGFQKIINLHLLRPVRCVEDQRLAKCRIVPDKPDFIQEHLP